MTIVTAKLSGTAVRDRAFAGMTYQATETPSVTHAETGAWVLPAIFSAVLAVAWGAYTSLVFYEIVFLSAG